MLYISGLLLIEIPTTHQSRANRGNIASVAGHALDIHIENDVSAQILGLQIAAHSLTLAFLMMIHCQSVDKYKI